MKVLVGLAAVIPTFLFLVGSVVGEQVADKPIEIDFEVSLVSFKEDGISEKARKKYLGQCWLANNRWLLRVHYMDNAVEELYCDGTNIIKKTSQFAAPRNQNLINARYGFTNTLSRPSQSQANNVFVRIVPGLHPLDNLWINVPWLAFCSDMYLAQPERLVPFPSGWTRHLPNAFGYEDKTSLLPGNPGLPLSCELFASSKLFTLSPFDERLARTDRVLRVRSSPRGIVKNGLLQFQYQVINWTNLVDRAIPTEFEFTEYRPTRDGDLIVKLEGIGKVLRIASASSVPDIIPEELGAVVTDYRFRSPERLVDSIAYKLRNWQPIPSFDDPKLQTVFLEAEKNSPVDISLGSNYRRVLVVILVCFLPFGLLMFWYFSAKKSRWDKKQNRWKTLNT